jgi:hypothetical protein
MINNNIKVKTRIDNKNVFCIFSESIIIPSSDFPVVVDLNGLVSNWEIEFKFITDNTIHPYTVHKRFDNNKIFIEHYNWHSKDWINYKEPIYISSQNKSIELFVNINTIASFSKLSRTILITIWQVYNG